jgi:hypothetical protein
MSVSVHNHLDTVPCEQTDQPGSIGESFPPFDYGRQRRMVDEQNSEQALSAGQIEEITELGHLCGPKASCSEKRSGWARRGHSNQHDMPAHTYTWKE